MRPGGEHRGNARDRRARKLWLLSPVAGFGGNGERVPCAFCGEALDYAAVEADRFPIPGRAGGGYERGNIRPACRACREHSW